MLDIKFVRENSDVVRENLKKKFQEQKLSLVDDVLSSDIKYRKILQEVESLKHERNVCSQEINKNLKSGMAKDSPDMITLFSRSKEIPQKIKELDESVLELKDSIRNMLMDLPNIIHDSVPIGKDDTKNVELERIGEPEEKDFEVLNHAEIAEQLGIADFETSAKTSGAGFYYLKGDLALLNMALINFARDYMMKENFMYVEPPLMIKADILRGVYSNDEIDAMSYKIEGEDLYLIATSEHSLIGGFIGKTLEEKDLPIRMTGYSMCFRKEIGSHGIDEKGLYRTHQFNKQEMIVICKPEDSYKYYHEILGYSKGVFEALGLPSRVLECCSGDLGDLKAKSADLEVWSPRRKGYFEVCSCSNLTDAQSRRLNIRVNTGTEKYFPHTLNNTVIATSRALVGILENYQNADGSITIPKVLVSYMGNKTKIEAKLK